MGEKIEISKIKADSRSLGKEEGRGKRGGTFEIIPLHFVCSLRPFRILFYLSIINGDLKRFVIFSKKLFLQFHYFRKDTSAI